MRDSINFQKLADSVRGFGSTAVLVVGDLMLDRFVWGEVSRISPEAPVPVVEVQKETVLLGGAANVANNIRGLGGGCILGGVIGDDDAGSSLMALAEERDIDTSVVVQDAGPTTVKTRIVARGQQVVRVDREDRRGPVGAVLDALRGAFARVVPSAGCVVVSDYAKGVITHDIMISLRALASDSRVPLLVDPKPSNMDLYRGVTMLTPNSLEAGVMSGIEIADDNTLDLAASRIMSNMDADAVLVTRGSSGMGLLQKGKPLFTIPTMAREVFDVTGAGDTVIATFAMGIANGLEMPEAAWLANMAAGIVVGKVGTATVSGSELVKMLEKYAAA